MPLFSQSVTFLFLMAAKAYTTLDTDIVDLAESRETLYFASKFPPIP